MELRNSELSGINRLAGLWTTTPDSELEALITDLGLTGWQDIIQYLRSLGMREEQQNVKLNISLSNNIRFTLEGAGVIQAYCRDNRLSDKPFSAMLKEPITDADPIALGAYSAKIKLKREIPLASDDSRIQEALANWDKLGKHFRNIQRFEFVAPGGVPIRFDLSIVRENVGRPARTFQEARLQNPKYEAEAELTAGRDTTGVKEVVQYIVRCLSWMLQGNQRSYVLVSNPVANAIRDSIGKTFGSRRGFRYPGPQPATLERKNIVADAEPGVPNLRTMPGGYNVTDKADGLRCMLTVADSGFIFLVDGGGRVYATGKKVDQPSAITGLALDGEWIRRNRHGGTVSHYYAFDILAAKGGDTSIASQPFMIAGAMLGSTVAKNTRQAVMSYYVGLLGNATQMVRGVPPSENIQIGMKTFLSAEGSDIFQAGAAATLDYAKSAPYNTDGLIFTPNAVPLPLGGGTWPEQLKWKPPHENTIDFLVIIDQERDSKGLPTGVDAISTKYRDDSGQTVRHKTLRLFVGSSRDVAFADPRTTILSGERPKKLHAGEWREVEFRPVNPRDPMASICYVAISEGGEASDVIRTNSGDVIQSNMIVEMAYYAERAPGWRWVPTRIRHDKTERFLIQQTDKTRKGGTMNADWVANSIWNSIHNPVMEDAICSGRISYCASPAPVGGRRANGRDQLKVQCMRNFHDYVKRILLRKSILTPGSTICDLAMGNGEDIGKWIAASVSFAFGCDFQGEAINSPEDGAYRRLLDKVLEISDLPPMIFAQADIARSLRDGTAGVTPEDTVLLRKVFAEHSVFDMVSCMFALHHMFRDEATLGGFLMNLADTVKVGGYFVGCFRDGDSVMRLLAEPSVVGRDDSADVWVMTKQYGDNVGTSVPPTALGLGLAVGVDFIAGGETVTEYLVSWPYLQSRLAECGLELLTGEEVTIAGLPAATQMFSETWKLAEAGGDIFSMSDAIRRLSFMNRWFIMRRRSDRRPVHKPAVTEVPKPVEPEPEPEPEPRPEPEVFVVQATNRVSDMRLGPELADWPRYLSLEALAILTDTKDPSIKYPTIEAAICSAKYQLATNRPELGPTFFRIEGDIHQKAEANREKLTDPDAIAKTLNEEAAQMRELTTKRMRSAYKATWDQEAWDTQKEAVYKAYLNQRFLTDARFRTMLEAIRARKGTIAVAYSADPVTLGVSLNPDKTVAGGENLLGKWLLELGATS